MKIVDDIDSICTNCLNEEDIYDKVLFSFFYFFMSEKSEAGACLAMCLKLPNFEAGRAYELGDYKNAYIQIIPCYMIVILLLLKRM